MLVQEGIVLRTYVPYKQKLSILDAQLGRIEGIPRNIKLAHRISHGAFISYTAQKKQMNYIIHDANILNAPFYWAHNNFLFFHHVLELCYYFLPLDNVAEDIFALIQTLYTLPQIMQTDISKKVFLCKLFMRLGIYPPDITLYDSLFFRLISGPFDSKVNAHDERNIDAQLYRWLLACISTHPFAHRLKTINFLKKLDVYE